MHEGTNGRLEASRASSMSFPALLEQPRRRAADLCPWDAYPPPLTGCKHDPPGQVYQLLQCSRLLSMVLKHSWSDVNLGSRISTSPATFNPALPAVNQQPDANTHANNVDLDTDDETTIFTGSNRCDLRSKVSSASPAPPRILSLLGSVS